MNDFLTAVMNGVPTAVIGALSGAIVAALVSLFVLRTQRKDQYHERLRAAVRSTITAVLRFSDAAKVHDGLEEERSAVLASAEFVLLISTGRGEDAQLADLMGTEFVYLSSNMNSTRSENTAELIAHVAALANPKANRRAIAERVHETAEKFRPYPLAPDLPTSDQPADGSSS